MHPIIIVGGGAAAHGAVTGMRAAGFKGQVILIGREPEPPYERPPLSKRFLIEDLDRTALHFPRPDCELRLGEEVVEIEPGERRVRLASGERVAYEQLLLTTGGRARPLPGHEDAFTLRQVDDAERLRQVLASGGPLTIIGAGFIAPGALKSPSMRCWRSLWSAF
jgi:3-phenylpropionate/trans-cinnamate dioxygenase ferredoxin reductase subunit